MAEPASPGACPYCPGFDRQARDNRNPPILCERHARSIMLPSARERLLADCAQMGAIERACVLLALEAAEELCKACGEGCDDAIRELLEEVRRG